MSKRASATRYARALFDVALAENSGLDVIDSELQGLARLLTQYPELQRSLFHAAVPISAKRAVVQQLLEKSPVPSPLAKLLLLLADRDRLDLVPDLATAFNERVMEHNHVVRAEIVTAQPLEADRAAALERRLAGATGRSVLVTTRVDPQILGGVVARVGSTVYDGSVATQLARMRGKLVESL